MTGKEKIKAALSQGTQATPAVIPYEGIYIRDHWEQVTRCPWWYEYSAAPEQQLAWRCDAIAATGQDWFVLPQGLPRQVRERLVIEVQGDEVWRVDRRTGRAQRLERPAVAGWNTKGEIESIRPTRLMETPAEIDALCPLPEGDPAAVRSDGSADLADALLTGAGAGLFPIAHVSSPLWSGYGIWGFEGLMTMVATRPDLVEYACRRQMPSILHAIRRAAALGALGIWIEECFTDMLSPRSFAALNLPFLQEITAEIRACGLASIYYYCGNPAGKWDLLLAAGADALSLEESKKGFTIDIEEVVDRVQGRCAVLGNLDAIGLLEHGSEAELRAEIARQLAAGRRNGGRFIMSLGSPVTPGTTVQRVRLYCDLVHELSGI